MQYLHSKERGEAEQPSSSICTPLFMALVRPQARLGHKLLIDPSRRQQFNKGKRVTFSRYKRKKNLWLFLRYQFDKCLSNDFVNFRLLITLLEGDKEMIMRFVLRMENILPSCIIVIYHSIFSSLSKCDYLLNIKQP